MLIIKIYIQVAHVSEYKNCTFEMLLEHRFVELQLNFTIHQNCWGINL